MTYNLRSRKRIRCSTPGIEIPPQQEAARTVRTSLPSFPVELLLEIFSYWPSIPISRPDSPALFPNIYLERTRTLQALTQTCSSLRAILLPLAWQNLEACSCSHLPPSRPTPSLAGKYGNEVMTELLRQAEIVTIRNPTLAIYVQTVSVTLTKIHATQVFEEFARCLSLLPNVKTLQIFGLGFEGAETKLSRAFASVILPSVRVLAVPREGVALFSSVPNVRDITFLAHNHTYHTEYCARSVARHFPHIERLRFRGSLVATNLDRLTHKLPELRELGPVGLDYYVPMSRHRGIVPLTSLECLSRLEKIHVLYLTINGYGGGGTQDLSLYREHIRLVKEILRQAPAQKQELKKVVVRYPGSTQVYIGKGVESLEEAVDNNSTME
ncbi:uncharacterized protein ARMOST_16029 [Armillaria ostoyae]|uniref:F-box domain-containing protein n=1 Tax=Armillaria ostoyae TaxID=47428 RepID=A0A284RV22_ARMOS|nr:uncharacterized protein ARMOST_16029 [Armillaria ostoyae]